jgi:acyl-CoA thioesterase
MTSDPPWGEALEKKRQLFNDCEAARLLVMECTEVWDGGARVVMDCAGKLNAMGVCHGGAIFALADQAFGIAANQREVQVAVSVHIEYIAPAIGRLEAVAARRSETENRSLYQVRIFESERLVAEFEGVAWKK